MRLVQALTNTNLGEQQVRHDMARVETCRLLE